MKPLLYILTLIFLAASCFAQDNKTVKANKQFDILPLPADSTAFYFKLKNNWKDTTKNALDTFVNRWYSQMLFALKEPVLKDYRGDKAIYRFTWLRTFHHPVAIRVEKQGNIIKLFTKVCKGEGGYKPGQIFFDKTTAITIEQYNVLQQKINDIGFWNLATEKRDGAGFDGSEWIIEAVNDNNYHLVTRWTPGKAGEGNFSSVGEYLIAISKISESELKNVY